MNRENRTSSRRERDSSEREQRNEVGKVRTDMRGSGMTDRRWPVGWSLVVSSHSRHSVLSSLRPSFTHSIPSLRLPWLTECSGSVPSPFTYRSPREARPPAETREVGESDMNAGRK